MTRSLCVAAFGTKSTTTPASLRGCVRMMRPIRCWYTRREAVAARCMQTVARGEFQPSASSIALMRTLISPRSYAASVSPSRTGGLRSLVRCEGLGEPHGRRASGYRLGFQTGGAEFLGEVVRVLDAGGVDDA